MKFVGYHERDALPIKKGDIVTIPKGTYIKTLHPKHAGGYRAKRTYKVKVFDMVRGMTDFRSGEPVHKMNPMVEWPGTGGYWCWVDINDIPEANTEV